MATFNLLGETILVDDEDLHFLSTGGWTITGRKATRKYRGYVYLRNGRKGKGIALARLILGITKKRDEQGRHICVDHINGNTLDNRRCNLRIVHGWLNATNRHRQANNRSGCPGVHYEQGRWAVRVGVDYKQIYLGRYPTFEEAKVVRERYLKKVLESGSERHLLTFPRFNQNKSGIVGVYFNNQSQKWIAMIRGKYLGAFDTKQAAIEVRQAAEKRDLDRESLKGLCT